MSFGQNLIAIRESKHMSRGELAVLLDIPYTTLRNYETDQREPGHKLLIKIANLFCISVDSLIGNEKNSPVSPESETRWQELHSNFDKLNDLGQEYLIEYSDFLLSKEKYQKAVISKKTALSGKTERIFRAARSEDNTPPEWVDMPVEEVERIFNAPESKTNL